MVWEKLIALGSCVDQVLLPEKNARDIDVVPFELFALAGLRAVPVMEPADPAPLRFHLGTAAATLKVAGLAGYEILQPSGQNGDLLGRR